MDVARAAAGKKKSGRPRYDGGRERILLTALDLFAEHGYEAISTNQIAQQAESSQSVILYHFENKLMLWQEAMRHLFARADVTTKFDNPLLKDLTPIDKFRVLVRSFVHFSARNPALGRVIFREGLNGGPRLTWLLDELGRTQYSVFVRAIEELVRNGTIKPVHPVMLTLMLHGAGATLFNLGPLSRALMDEDPFAPAIVQQQTDLLIELLFSGLLPDAPRRQASPIENSGRPTDKSIRIR